MTRIKVFLLLILTWLTAARFTALPDELEIREGDVGSEPLTLQQQAGTSRQLTWWLPQGGDTFVLPLSAGLLIESGQEDLLQWLRDGSPWPLTQLPALGVRYGERTLVVIVPWPHYAELVVRERIGIRFEFPVDRNNATPCQVVAGWAGGDPLEVARVFRQWRRSAADVGAIPRPRPLSEKAERVPRVARLFGAPHFYLWGSALFSRFDVKPSEWPSLARLLDHPAAGSLAARLASNFSLTERDAVSQLAQSGQAAVYLTRAIAAGVARVLSERPLLGSPDELPVVDVIERNRKAVAAGLSEFLVDPERWGDGPSLEMIDALRAAGISRALLLLSDLYGQAPRPDVAARADASGFLLGPYDSYHSVHSPNAPSEETWETAQFDRRAYEKGRVLNADGSGHRGFQGAGYHFSPLAAWPYVQARVGRIMEKVPYSTWFVDCDATAECFDDYSPERNATRVDDMNARRHRLEWIESEFNLPVGSEDGSVLVADLIHFGHGVHTPFIAHLDPAFRDPKSRYFLGRYWPPDAPDIQFKPVPVAPSVLRPYFDPRVRIPLYQAALGDEVIGTHHWSFDSLKFSDLCTSRELMEILYMVPPLYHVSRGTWPERREQIARHVSFWAPLHRQLCPISLIRFECLSSDRLLQRTTFLTRGGEVGITVNFDGSLKDGYPPFSATVSGPIEIGSGVYRAVSE